MPGSAGPPDNIDLGRLGRGTMEVVGYFEVGLGMGVGVAAGLDGFGCGFSVDDSEGEGGGSDEHEQEHEESEEEPSSDKIIPTQHQDEEPEKGILMQRVQSGLSTLSNNHQTQQQGDQHGVEGYGRGVVWARFLNEEGEVRGCCLEDVEEADFSRFERIIVRPPRTSEINRLVQPYEYSHPMHLDAQTRSMSKGQEGLSDLKEMGMGMLKWFFERLGRWEESAGAGPGPGAGLEVELGFWTGLSNEVWQSIISLPTLKSLKLVHPRLPDNPVRLGTRSGTNGLGSVGQMYTPFFLLPKVASEDEGEGEGWGCGLTTEEGEEGGEERRALGHGLKSLSLDNLSLVGTKNLANHLLNLTEIIPVCPLESLRINTLFFDAGLCAAVASIGSCGVLRELTIGTKGTKLLSAGFKEMVEGCVGLERLVVDQVEGRLVKTLWKDIEAYPEDLKEISIIVNESGTHHSWTLDHLASFSHAPFDQLTTLQVTRAVPPSAAMPFHPAQREGDQPRQIPKVHDLCYSQPILDDIYQAILDKGKSLTRLNLDWWEIDEERLARLIKTLIGLEELTVRLNFPLFRLVTVTAFPSTSHLSLFRVSLVPTEQLCWEMDNTKVTGRTTKSAPLNKIAIKPEVTEAALQSLPEALVTLLRTPDSTIPASKEIKKFARKLPRLERLEWTGREGKGSWNIIRPAADKKVGLLTVEFKHSAMDHVELWTEMTSDPIELSSFSDQDVPVSDVPPPATPSCATFSPASNDFQTMSPMTMGSTIASEDPETPLARWASPHLQSFPSLTGAWVKETREEGGWGALGLENISPSPSSNTIADKNKRRGASTRTDRKPAVAGKAISTSAAPVPPLPSAETSATPETPRRRGRRGGVGRSRGQGGAASGAAKTLSSKPSPETAIKPALPTASPDGWMTVSTKKAKEPAKGASSGENKTKRGKK